MIKRISIDLMIPQLMKLVRFHGKLTVDGIRRYTNYGKASINSALTSMIKNGLIKKEGREYELTKDSEHWLGWNKGF